MKMDSAVEESAADGCEVGSHEAVLERLSCSKFRSSFKLNDADLAYARSKGRACIEQHARDFVLGRLASALPKNDGKQTPMKGHPVFKAMHACACCCRGCLSKWHGIPQSRALSEREQDWIVALLMAWIDKQAAAAAEKATSPAPAASSSSGTASAECKGQTHLNL